MKKADASGKPSIFLLTPLREGRRASSQMRTNICGFLLTPLREGRPDASLAPELFTRLFLLTPLREGRHDLQSRITTMNRISTHAPAGGATKLTTGEVNTDIISTHAPAGGATNRRTQPAARQSISTHAPAGGATRRDWKKNGSRIISTHAPAGGATPNNPNVRKISTDFYSRPCGRGDEIWRDAMYAVKQDFYSRPCGRGDACRDLVLLPAQIISTHAPAGGATYAALAKAFLLDKISTHAPAGGATIRSPELGASVDLFLLTPLREGRR